MGNKMDDKEMMKYLGISNLNLILSLFFVLSYFKYKLH